MSCVEDFYAMLLSLWTDKTIYLSASILKQVLEQWEIDSLINEQSRRAQYIQKTNSIKVKKIILNFNSR